MIRKKTKVEKLIIDLTGSNGNAWVLMGLAKRYCRDLNLDYNKICREMMAGDYENLIKVFDSYFGDYVILER